MDLGFHIADFTWNGGPPATAPTLARVAREAEAGGIARLTVMDHFWQIGPIGAPEESMLEAYTTLGYLAAVTERVLLHTLVTGVVYRDPGWLAKAISTLDVLSGGRAVSRGGTTGSNARSTRRHRSVDPTRSCSSAAVESARPCASSPSTPTPATSSAAIKPPQARGPALALRNGGPRLRRDREDDDGQHRRLHV
jgi:alkanesulfonate monooxygenase SsuD/methylene tetrahydromethanopterin reductase-like flavin-dependent oxidoreductase (luciferase family)